MKKSTLKNLFLIVLLISNSILLFMWWNAPEHKHRQPKEVIIEKLDFNESQVKEYEKLIKEHRKAIRTLESTITSKKQLLFTNVEKPFSDSIANEIALEEKKILQVHYNHFKDIEKLCKGEQKNKFKEFSKEIIQLFRPTPPQHEKHD